MTPPLGHHSLTVVMMTMLMLRAVMMTDQSDACLDDLEVIGLLRASSVLITRMIL